MSRGVQTETCALFNHETSKFEEAAALKRTHLFVVSVFSRFTPTSDTASDVQSLESIMRLHCCTSSSRTSDKPFDAATFPPRFLSFLPLSPLSHSYICPTPRRLLDFYNLLNASYAKSHHTLTAVCLKGASAF